MTSDRLEITLESRCQNRDWDNVTLLITAYLKGGGDINDNTIFFYGDPAGSHCEKTYLEVEFPNREAITEMYQFLSHHLQKDDKIERSCRIPVVDGKRSSTWANGRRRKTGDFDHFTVSANSERVSFGPMSTMTPSIRFYETATEEGPQDQRNGERLLTFLEEFSDSAIRKDGISLHDEQLLDRCVPLFEDEKYPEAARLAGQILEERVNELAPKSHTDSSGATLMRNVFSPDGGSLQIASDDGEQAGLMSLFAGTYQAVRNPLSHRTPDPDGEQYLDDLDLLQTRNILHLVDYLLTTLDRHQEKLEDENIPQ